MQAPWIFLVFAAWWLVNPPMPTVHHSVRDVGIWESAREGVHFLPRPDAPLEETGGFMGMSKVEWAKWEEEQVKRKTWYESLRRVGNDVEKEEKKGEKKPYERALLLLAV